MEKMNTSKKRFIYGVHPVMEALRSAETIDRVMLSVQFRSPHKAEIMKLAKLRGVPVYYLPEQALKNLTREQNHQGVVAELSMITYQDIEYLVPMWFDEGKLPIVLILDKITDVRNAGSIVRTAECAGVSAIVVPWKHSSDWNEITVKTSAGAVFSIPICRTSSLTRTVKFLSESGFEIVACTEKAQRVLYEHNFRLPLAIIVGNEEKGISMELLRLSHIQLQIPLLGHISSLNVSVATGIILYEAIRQLHFSFRTYNV